MVCNKYLIIIDDDFSVLACAQAISASLPEGTDIIKAADFSGENILGPNMLFFGCNDTAPASFTYLENVLRHINLIDRHCALFSPSSEQALNYLKGIVRDSEIKIAGTFTGTDQEEIKKWVLEIINK